MGKAIHDLSVLVEGKKAVHTKMTVKPPAAGKQGKDIKMSNTAIPELFARFLQCGWF